MGGDRRYVPAPDKRAAFVELRGVSPSVGKPRQIRRAAFRLARLPDARPRRHIFRL